MLHSVLDPRQSVRTDLVLRQTEKAVKAGRDTVFIVPEQATAAYEFLLAQRLGAPAQKRLEVTNFSRLRDVVLRQVGGVAKRVPDGVEKDLLLALTLMDFPGEAQLLSRSFDSAAVSELASDLEEARMAGLGEKELTALAETDDVSPRLAEKMRAASLVAAAWRRRMDALADVCPDPEQQLCDALDRVPFFEGKIVLIHDFRDFTRPQLQILRRLMTQAAELWVTLPCARTRDELYEVPFRCYEDLLRLARDAGVDRTVEQTEPDGDENELAFLRRHLLTPGARWEGKNHMLSAVLCGDEWEEAAFVADRVRRFVTEEGCAWREIAVLSRDRGTDLLLSQVLTEQGIPHFLEEKRPLAETPGARLLLLAAKIALDLAFRGEERAYLQNPLLDLEDEDRFLLEKYVATWRLSPAVLRRAGPFDKNPDGYADFDDRTRAELARINAARERVLAPLQGLAVALSAEPTAEKVTALVSFLRAVGGENASRRMIAAARQRQDFEEAASVARAWNCALSRLGTLAEIAGDRPVSGRDFFRLLGIALGGDAPGEVPPAQDAVFLGTVDFARPGDVKKLFLIGMNAGVFPRGETPGRLFSDVDRDWIYARGYALSHPELRRKEEAFYFASATQIPREEMLLSWRANGDAARDKGSESVFVKRCRALFPELPETVFWSGDALPKTKRDAFRLLLAHLDDPDIAKTELFRYFAQGEEKERLMTAAAGQSFCRDTELKTEKPYESGDLFLSYSGIEEYTRCRFKFFADRLLKAKEDPSGDLGVAPVGTFIHAMLEELLRGVAEEGAVLGDLSEKEVLDRADRIRQKLFDAWFGKELSPSLARQLALVTRDALSIVRILWREAKVSAFRPVLFEQSLTDLPDPYKIPLPDGRDLVLVGFIDRVDLYRNSKGEDYVRVVDYKSGAHSFKLSDLASGLDLQMLLYLFALWDKPVPVPGETVCPKPAGVLYVTGVLKEEKKIDEEDLSRLRTEDVLPLQRSGLFVDDPELLAAQDPEGKGRFLPVLYQNKKDSPGLVTARQLGRLKHKVEKELAALSGDILAGKIEARRMVRGGQDPCQWCPYLPLCKRSPGAKRYGAGKISSMEELLGEEEEA
ncbi:MAG: PD-(D/E)XK nuclease family protein [Clostridia bacterium]|nr:PD-(D/E)XK nuclease family protein [Clostridia bacterium]